MPPPSVTGEEYCFPRRPLIISFGMRVILLLKGTYLRVHSEIDSVCLSVCTTIFKRIAGLHFYPKSLMLTSMDSIQRAPQTNGKFFSKFEFLGENQFFFFFKRIERCEY